MASDGTAIIERRVGIEESRCTQSHSLWYRQHSSLLGLLQWSRRFPKNGRVIIPVIRLGACCSHSHLMVAWRDPHAMTVCFESRRQREAHYSVDALIKTRPIGPEGDTVKWLKADTLCSERRLDHTDSATPVPARLWLMFQWRL